MRHRGIPLAWFRYTYNHTGTKEKKAAIERFLAERGYRIAPHTIDSTDYIFNIAYLYSKERGDRGVATRICATYVDFVLGATVSAEDVAREIFGEDIPQTLLLHANDINADWLDALLRAFKQQGYSFVSLNAALSDPAYQTSDTLVTDYGPTWLWRWNKSKGTHVSFRGAPVPPGWIKELYHEALAATPDSK